MPEKNVVKHGDVTQRVGVEVIRARGVDVEKLIKMLIANAAAEFCQHLLLLHHSSNAPCPSFKVLLVMPGRHSLTCALPSGTVPHLRRTTNERRRSGLVGFGHLFSRRPRGGVRPALHRETALGFMSAK
jgi:hypothetical protein